MMKPGEDVENRVLPAEARLRAISMRRKRSVSLGIRSSVFRRSFPAAISVRRKRDDRGSPQQSTGRQPPRANGTMKGRGTPGGLRRNIESCGIVNPTPL
jgi:hypothetical protein